jgi:hypothetical protein
MGEYEIIHIISHKQIKSAYFVIDIGKRKFDLQILITPLVSSNSSWNYKFNIISSKYIQTREFVLQRW